MDKIIPHVFDNGLPAIFISLPYSRGYTICLLTGAGSRMETAESKGLARFYTNCCLQGSKQYPNKAELDKAMNLMGLNIKPGVYPEYSLFYFFSTLEKLIPSFELFINLFFQPSLSIDNLEAEKKISLTEIEISGRNPQFSSMAKLSADIFNNHPIGFDILGEKEAIQNFDQQKVNEFKDKFYVSQNCLLLIIGPENKFDFSCLNDIVKIIPFGSRHEPEKFDFSQTKIVQDKIIQSGQYSILNYGFPCYGRDSEKKISQNLLLTLLYENPFYNRFKVFQEKKLMASAKAWIRLCYECGLFLIQASCQTNQEKAVQEEIMAVFSSLANNSITNEELEISKNFYENQFLSRMGNTLEVAFFYMLTYFYNLNERTPEEIVDKIKKTSLEEINGLASQIFKPNMASWVISGP